MRRCYLKYLLLSCILFFVLFLLGNSVSAIEDNSPPSLSVTISVENGINVNETANISVYASDNYADNIILNISVNNESYWNVTVGNPGVSDDYSFNISDDWSNWISVHAEDENNNSYWSNTSYMIYTVNFTIVNESDSSGFNYANSMEHGNLTHFFLFIPDLEETYDMLVEQFTSFQYVTDDPDELLRFSLKYRYTDGTIIRGFVMSLLDPVCKIGFPEMEQSFYENLVYSTTSKEVIVKNINSDCYIYADYTRYAGTNQFTASIICIDMLYYLYTVDDGRTVMLSSLEGSKSALINLDFLDYENFDVDFNLLENQFAIVPYTNHSVLMYYLNLQGDNSILKIDIFDGDTLIFTYVETDNPDEFLSYFDWLTISLTNDLIEVRVTVTKDDGSTETFSQYFSVSIAAAVADTDVTSLPILFLAVGFVFFLLTFVSSNQVFGAVGIITMVIGIAFTTITNGEWYVVFIQSIFVILLLFVVLIARSEGRSKVV